MLARPISQVDQPLIAKQLDISRCDEMASQVAVGIDIGGTGIKGALVEVETGKLCGPRQYLPTPQPATPDAIAETVKHLRENVSRSMPEAPVGIAFPAVVRNGIVRTAANIHSSWIGTDAAMLFQQILSVPVALLNDADAAGLAEMKLGSGKDEEGVVFVVTLGTGIGSALFAEGHLVPNTELGHLTIDGFDCCPWAATAAIAREQLSWAQWVSRVQEYLGYAESLLWPDLIIIGGGVSDHADRFLPLIQLGTPIVPAKMSSDSGIIGAAIEALRLRFTIGASS